MLVNSAPLFVETMERQVNLVPRDKDFEILRSGLNRKGLAKYSDIIDRVCRAG